MGLESKPQLCYVDVGGTFTDAIVVAEDGSFTLAKSFSTPHDVSEGFYNALVGVAESAGLSLEELLRDLSVLGYGSTIVLNTLLTRGGERVGLIVTAGFEQLLLMERGKQTWTEYERVDRIHPVTHRHLNPLLPINDIRGVTERMNCFGEVVVPIYEKEARTAVKQLLENGVEALAICFLWSFLNEEHERRAVEIAREVMEEQRCVLPVYASVDISPVMRELSRANATVIEAYTRPKAMAGLLSIEDRLQEGGFRGVLQVMQSSGGLAPLRQVKMVDTVQSGPVGGVIGGRFIGKHYNLENILTSDMGGTSFDVALVTSGQVPVNREPVAVGMILGVPMVEILSIGAGGGTMATIDPLTNRINVGPESAGSDPGPVCFGRGGTIPTITDADLVLGYINPSTYGYGRQALDLQAATDSIRTYLAEPLGVSVEEAAMGMRRILDARMADTIDGLVAARGFDLRDYHLLAFGGAGPTHVAGYTEGLSLAGILVFPYSSVFSAFGASAADYQHHYNRSCNIVIPPNPNDEVKMGVGEKLNALWSDLARRAIHQMEAEGFARADTILQPQAMLRYGRQLNDLVVPSPVQRIDSPADFDRLIGAFEHQYEQIYAKAAKFPQSGYDIFEVGMVATAPKIRPKLPHYSGNSATPPSKAYLGERAAYFGGEWVDTPRFEMRALRPNNVIRGPAIIEDPTTTFVLPPGTCTEVDQHLTFWVTRM